MNLRHTELALNRLRWVVESKATVDMSAWMNECGTVGCGWGWIASDPDVKKTGVYYTKPEVDDDGYVEIGYEGKYGFYGASLWLDIDLPNAFELFHATTYYYADARAIPQMIKKLEAMRDDFVASMQDQES